MPDIYKDVDGKRILMTAEELAEKENTPIEVKVKFYQDEVQSHLDKLAQSWGYDNIVSLCSYAGNSHPKYSLEGAAGLLWRSTVWDYCEKELAKIEAGTRPEPASVDEFIAELPVIVRPTV
jgi:hypothetical protein